LPCAGHPRLSSDASQAQTWMAGTTSPAMTTVGISFSSDEPAAVEERTFGDVAPIHDRPTELHVARVDFPGKIVAGSGIGDDLCADREKGLEEGVVEFQNLDAAFVSQLAQRQGVVGVELSQGARIFACGHGLEHPPLARVQAFP